MLIVSLMNHPPFKRINRIILPPPTHRHPDPSHRPKFYEIYSLLHSSGPELLLKEEEDRPEGPTPTATASGSSTSQWQIGGTLGDRDNEMFLDLQTMYRDS